MKILTKKNNGWVFNNYIDDIKIEKIGRFIMISA